MEENRPLDTGDEKQRDDDKPVLREQCDGAQHEQGRSRANLFAEYIVSVRPLRWHTTGWAGRAWAGLGGGVVLGGTKYVRRRRNVGAGRVRTGREGVLGRRNKTYRSLAGPLVEGVESLTVNG